MPKKTKGPKESEIQHAILEWLFWKSKAGKLFYWRQNVLPVPITVRGRVAGFRPGGTPGCPDIAVIVAPNGNFVGLEVKAPDGVQSDGQVEFERRLKEVGAEYYVVRSVEDVEKALGLSTG